MAAFIYLFSSLITFLLVYPQLNEYQHIRLAPSYCEFVNHHCSPNVFFDLAKGELRAIQAIAVGDVLSSFYPSHEWDMDEKFDCCCGDALCIGRVEGARFLATDAIARYQFTEVMARLLKQEHPQLNITVVAPVFVTKSASEAEEKSDVEGVRSL